MSLVKLIDLPNFGDERGGLVAIESNQSIPFDVKRLYYIFNTVDKPRGFHAHLDLKQVAICLKGSCRFILDDGRQKEEIVLNSPDQGLLIEGLIWREMHDFSEDCVLLVLASDHYDESDYIREYEQFTNYSILKLVEYNYGFLEKSWDWLKDEELKYLTMTPGFTKRQQEDFFESLPTRKDYYIYGISFKEVAIGACGLKNLIDDKAELWLYIGNKEYWGRGLGKKVMALLENDALEKGIKKLYLKVLKENKVAINLYKKLNYVDIEEYDEYIVMEKIL
ncbi:GNAT family N-acetyltransferase [Acinetobacter sp. YH01020]|uniref:GNAT family N-acetyltransferase n=1 Tax=Acinetobacter sp. YH01020 TaxID=2601034 RepID=UPI0015D320AE|nr:GNAT family N-acetyltransferase [Acinetobacter sp. YH01020]